VLERFLVDTHGERGFENITNRGVYRSALVMAMLNGITTEQINAALDPNVRRDNTELFNRYNIEAGTFIVQTQSAIDTIVAVLEDPAMIEDGQREGISREQAITDLLVMLGVVATREIGSINRVASVDTNAIRAILAAA